MSFVCNNMSLMQILKSSHNIHDAFELNKIKVFILKMTNTCSS